MASRGKARSFDFDAIEHVGNDADEGGFLGNESAEAERRGGREGSPEAQVPAPAVEPEPQPAPVRPPGKGLPAAVHDGSAFSPLTAEPPVTRSKPKRGGSRKPAQEAVMASFIAQRTSRNWVMWSGRLVPEVIQRLKDRAEADAASSARPRLKPGHYLDAALRDLPAKPADQVELANTWLIERWEGDHPSGGNAQFSISPENASVLKNLRKSLQGARHGVIIDLISASCDQFLDRLDQEGPLQP